LEGGLDRDAFTEAWRRVVARHAILRTSFRWEDGTAPEQVVGREADLPLEWLDLRPLPAAERERYLAEHRLRDRVLGFDLSRAPLMRLAVLQLADDRHYCHWTWHHILMD